MSYRNPTIITPPNYGEIYAKNMQYGASIVKSALDPVLDAIQEKKDLTKRGDTAKANANSEYRNNVRNIVDKKSGSFEGMTEDFLRKNSDAYAENARLYEIGKITVDEYNKVKDNLINEIYDAQGATENLNNFITFYTENETKISRGTDPKQAGLVHALTNPEESNLVITRKEEGGAAVFAYETPGGERVEFTYEDLNALKTNDILLGNDYSKNGETGKKLTDITNKHKGLASVGNRDGKIVRGFIGENSKFIPAENGDMTRQQTTKYVTNKSDIQTAIGLDIANSATAAEKKSYLLDRRWNVSEEEYVSLVTKDAMVYGQQFNISNTDKLAELLLTPYKKGMFIENDEGEKIDISKIANRIAIEGLTETAIASSELNPYFNPATNGIKSFKENPYQAPSITKEEVNRRLQQDDLLNQSFSHMSNMMSLIDYDDAKFDVEKAGNLGGLQQTIQQASGKIFDVNIKAGADAEKLATTLYDLGYNVERKADGGFSDKARIKEGDQTYMIFTLDKNLGVTPEKGAQTEIKIIDGKTSIFDVLAHRYAAEGLDLPAEEIKENFIKGPEAFENFIKLQKQNLRLK